jgi:hypothetical protein
MNQFTDLRDQILAGFDTLRGLSHVPGEYLSFRAGLYRAQMAAYDALDPALAAPQLPLPPASFKPGPAIAARIMAETAASLDEKPPARAKLEKLAGNGDLLVKAAAAAFGPDLPALERLAGETGTALDELLFFGRAVAAPYVSRMIAAAGEAAGPIFRETGPCPYCGSEAGLSFLRGDAGNRFLVCSLCGLEWGFPRVKCPFCGTDNKLEIITEGAQAPRWIELCSQCKCYLKIVDQRRLGLNHATISLLEVIQTLYLDFIAAKEGGQPGLPYVAIR